MSDDEGSESGGSLLSADEVADGLDGMSLGALPLGGRFYGDHHIPAPAVAPVMAAPIWPTVPADRLDVPHNFGPPPPPPLALHELGAVGVLRRDLIILDDASGVRVNALERFVYRGVHREAPTGQTVALVVDGDFLPYLTIDLPAVDARDLDALAVALDRLVLRMAGRGEPPPPPEAYLPSGRAYVERVTIMRTRRAECYDAEWRDRYVVYVRNSTVRSLLARACNGGLRVPMLRPLGPYLDEADRILESGLGRVGPGRWQPAAWRPERSELPRGVDANGVLRAPSAHAIADILRAWDTFAGEALRVHVYDADVKAEFQFVAEARRLDPAAGTAGGALHAWVHVDPALARLGGTEGRPRLTHAWMELHCPLRALRAEPFTVGTPGNEMIAEQVMTFDIECTPARGYTTDASQPHPNAGFPSAVGDPMISVAFAMLRAPMPTPAMMGVDAKGKPIVVRPYERRIVLTLGPTYALDDADVVNCSNEAVLLVLMVHALAQTGSGGRPTLIPGWNTESFDWQFSGRRIEALFGSERERIVGVLAADGIDERYVDGVVEWWRRMKVGPQPNNLAFAHAWWVLYRLGAHAPALAARPDLAELAAQLAPQATAAALRTAAIDQSGPLADLGELYAHAGIDCEMVGRVLGLPEVPRQALDLFETPHHRLLLELCNQSPNADGAAAVGRACAYVREQRGNRRHLAAVGLMPYSGHGGEVWLDGRLISDGEHFAHHALVRAFPDWDAERRANPGETAAQALMAQLSFFRAGTIADGPRRLPACRAYMVERRFRSRGQGTRINHTLVLPGVDSSFDCLVNEQKKPGRREGGNGLKNVIWQVLKRRTQEVAYERMPAMHQRSWRNPADPVDNTTLSQYVAADVEAVNAIIFAMSTIATFNASSRVLPLNRGATIVGGQTAGTNCLAVVLLKLLGFVLPERKRAFDTDRYSGGLVQDPLVGFYEEAMATFDFSALYPSIIRAYNLCTTTLIEQRPGESLADMLAREGLTERDIIHLPIKRFFTVAPHIRVGVIPTICGIFTDMRNDAKKRMKTAEEAGDADRAAQENVMQLLAKLLGNSVYGWIGSVFAILANKNIALAVTTAGMELILQSAMMVRDWFRPEQRLPYHDDLAARLAWLKAYVRRADELVIPRTLGMSADEHARIVAGLGPEPPSPFDVPADLTNRFAEIARAHTARTRAAYRALFAERDGEVVEAAPKARISAAARQLRAAAVTTRTPAITSFFGKRKRADGDEGAELAPAARKARMADGAGDEVLPRCVLASPQPMIDVDAEGQVLFAQWCVLRCANEVPASLSAELLGALAMAVDENRRPRALAAVDCLVSAYGQRPFAEWRASALDAFEPPFALTHMPIVAYGDTDSIMVYFDKIASSAIVRCRNADEARVLRAALGHIIGAKFGFVLDIYYAHRKTLSQVYEKLYLRYLLIGKKMYTGCKYEPGELVAFKVDAKGMAYAREIPLVLKALLGGVIDRVWKKGDIAGALPFVAQFCARVLAGEFPISDFIQWRKLGRVLDGYEGTVPIHIVVAKEENRRNPANPYLPGQRIGYVYVCAPAGAPVNARGKHPLRVLAGEAKLDHAYYITNVFQEPVTALLGQIVDRTRIAQTFTAALAEARRVMRVGAVGDHSNMLERHLHVGSRCVICNAVPPVDSMTLCGAPACMSRLPEVVAEVEIHRAREQARADELWTGCRDCAARTRTDPRDCADMTCANFFERDERVNKVAALTARIAGLAVSAQTAAAAQPTVRLPDLEDLVSCRAARAPSRL